MTPVLFLHGFLGAPSTFDRVEIEGTRAVLPGHGAAPDLSVDSFTGAVDAIAATLREPVIVAGYSMGARVALGLALRHPALVRGAVLAGVNPGLESAAERDERRRWDDEQAAALDARGLPAFVESWERLPLFASQASLAPELRAEERARRLSHTAAGAAHAMRALGLGRQPSLWGALRESPVPFTFLAGSLDTKFVESGTLAARVAPHGAFVMVGGAGHNLALEAPHALTAAIRSHRLSASHERTHA